MDGETEMLDFSFIDADGRMWKPQLCASITWNTFKDKTGLPRDGTGWYDTTAGKDQYVYNDATFKRFKQYAKGKNGVVFKQFTKDDFQSP